MANYDIESIWPNVPSEEWDFYKEYEDFDYVGGEDFWDNPAFKDLGLRKSEFKELELLPDFRKVGKFDSRKEITKEMKRLQDLPSSDDMDFSGWDALQKKLKDVPILGKIFEKYQPKTLYDMQKKYAMSRLANSLQEESLIPDDTYTGAQGRFDRPPKMMEKEMQETKVKALLGMGPGPEAEYTGPFGKIGEYFSKNAAARDKMFSMLGTMGRELVKPIEPGQEAAGALVPTLSRGLGKGAEEYAAKRAAAAKTALDMASARQKISPMQYYSSKMQEARLAVPKGIDPDSAEGKRWIGKYLMSIGMPSQVVDLQATVESMNLELLSISDEKVRKEKQALIDSLNRKIEDLVKGSIGGSSASGTIVPYNPQY